METVALICAVLILTAVLYFLASGVAFVLMYRIGERFPNIAVSRFFEPLEWLSHRSPLFSHLYNGLHRQSYRLFVGQLKGGWAPPPPNMGRNSNDSDQG
jgi:hypothetical protein